MVRMTVEFSLTSHLGDSPQSPSVFKMSSHLTETLGNHRKPLKPSFLPPDISL